MRGARVPHHQIGESAAPQGGCPAGTGQVHLARQVPHRQIAPGGGGQRVRRQGHLGQPRGVVLGGGILQPEQGRRAVGRQVGVQGGGEGECLLADVHDLQPQSEVTAGRRHPQAELERVWPDRAGGRVVGQPGLENRRGSHRRPFGPFRRIRRFGPPRQVAVLAGGQNPCAVAGQPVLGQRSPGGELREDHRDAAPDRLAGAAAGERAEPEQLRSRAAGSNALTADGGLPAQQVAAMGAGADPGAVPPDGGDRSALGQVADHRAARARNSPVTSHQRSAASYSGPWPEPSNISICTVPPASA